VAILRERLTAQRLVTSAQLARLPTGCEVTVAGLVIARQRPGTAKGTMFLLFEDELGTINLVVSKAVYERHRLLARAEPLLWARGRLERSREPTVTSLSRGTREMRQERHGQEAREKIRPVINVIVHELAPLERFLPVGVEEGQEAAGARVHRLPGAGRAADVDAEEEVQGAEVGSSMRAVAPPAQSFAAGRRR
jgi:error-prone DNA polymerase